MVAQNVEPELLRVGEVAARLRCSPEVVRRKLRSGELPGVRLGSGPRAPLRVPADALEAWLFGRKPPASGAGESVRSPRDAEAA
jgi:excisionase family DNA binding protein